MGIIYWDLAIRIIILIILLIGAGNGIKRINKSTKMETSGISGK